MIKKFFKISFYSFITFCVVNFLSLFISILSNKLIGMFPNFKFGFPFEIYHQFEIRSFGNCYELQHGFNINNIFYNIIISTVIVSLSFLWKSINFKLTKKNE